MRSYMFLAGTLFSVASALSQQNDPKNVVPKEALDGVFMRALQAPSFPSVTADPKLYRVPTQPRIMALRREPSVCAIPLLQAPIKETHDRIGRPARGPSVDPKMAIPTIPVCPKR